MTPNRPSVVSQQRPGIDLADRIACRRHEVQAYLKKATRRRRRMLNVTIVAGTAAAILTAAPALGGKPFAQGLTDVLGLSTPAWQFLCAAAAACSLTGTIAIQLLRSDNLEERIAEAQAVQAKLEILDLGLTTAQLDPEQATSEYFRCVVDSAFIPSGSSDAAVSSD
jgi:hypothetical protein